MSRRGGLTTDNPLTCDKTGGGDADAAAPPPDVTKTTTSRPGTWFGSVLGSPIFGEGGRRTMPRRRPSTPGHGDPMPSPKAIGGLARVVEHL